MRNVFVPAPSLRGQSASLRGFPDRPRRRFLKRLIRRSLLAIGRGFSAADRFFSLSSGEKRGRVIPETDQRRPRPPSAPPVTRIHSGLSRVTSIRPTAAAVTTALGHPVSAARGTPYTPENNRPSIN